MMTEEVYFPQISHLHNLSMGESQQTEETRSTPKSQNYRRRLRKIMQIGMCKMTKGIKKREKKTPIKTKPIRKPQIDMDARKNV